MLLYIILWLIIGGFVVWLAWKIGIRHGQINEHRKIVEIMKKTYIVPQPPPGDQTPPQPPGNGNG